MIRRPPRSTPLYSSASSDVYSRQPCTHCGQFATCYWLEGTEVSIGPPAVAVPVPFAPTRCESCSVHYLSLIHISEPMRHPRISYAVFCLKKKNKKTI